MHHLSMAAFAALMTLSATAGCYSGDAAAEESPSEEQGKNAVPPTTTAPGASSDPTAPGGALSGAPPAPQKTDLHHSAKGDPKNPAVVFIHGGPGANSKMFELTAQESIAKLGYYVIAYDQRGSTRSPKGTTADYSFAKATQDLDDLIGALGLKSPILLGHSFGGVLALHYLDRFKGKAKGAVLVASPMSFPATYDTTLAKCKERYSMWGRMSDASKVDTLRKTMFPNGVTPPYAYTGAEIGGVIECMSDAMLYFTPLPTQGGMSFLLAHGQDAEVTDVNPAVGDGFHANDKVGHADFTPLLAAHKNEVIGIYAPSWDAMFSKAQLATIQSNVRSYFSVGNAGHFVFVDQPETFTSTAGQALAQLK